MIGLGVAIMGNFSLSLRNLVRPSARQSGSGMETIVPKQLEQISSDKIADGGPLDSSIIAVVQGLITCLSTADHPPPLSPNYYFSPETKF